MADALPIVFEEALLPKMQRMQQRLEVALGRALAPADVEMLIANCFIYEMQLLCIAGNQAYRQNLVAFATDAALEYLAQLVGVVRLAASSAACTLQFDLVDGHNAVQIPAGLRVQSIDGTVIFTTNNAVDVPIGVNTVMITALCQSPGVVGNDYDVNKISIILDPQPFLVSAENIDITSGGNDEESDEQLRIRIGLAPSSFSVAGPSGAYKFFAKSAHPSIVDVAVITTNPGEVTLYPLCSNGTAPSDEIKNAVLAICDDIKVRPQNDTVLVDSPTLVNYDIEVELTTYTTAISQSVLDAVNTNLSVFKTERNNLLGMDVIVKQLEALSIIKDQVYTCTIISPATDIIADEKTYPKCNSITVTITGSNGG